MRVILGIKGVPNATITSAITADEMQRFTLNHTKDGTVDHKAVEKAAIESVMRRVRYKNEGVVVFPIGVEG